MGWVLWILSIVAYWFIMRSCFSMYKDHTNRKFPYHETDSRFSIDPAIVVLTFVVVFIPFANLILSAITWFVLFFCIGKRSGADWIKLIFRIK